MTEPLKNLERLAARARQDQPPSLDVAGRVLTELRSRKHGPGPASDWDWKLAEFSLGRWALAAVVPAAAAVIVGLPILQTIIDPLAGFFLIAASFIP